MPPDRLARRRGDPEARNVEVDSVPLGPSSPTGDVTADDEPGEPGESGAPRIRVANVKLLLAIFVAFLVVVSDVFTGSVIAGFGDKATRGRTPTAWGVVLQGIFLVIFYILAVYLTEHNII
jgi:hypothetical protein